MTACVATAPCVRGTAVVRKGKRAPTQFVASAGTGDRKAARGRGGDGVVANEGSSLGRGVASRVGSRRRGLAPSSALLGDQEVRSPPSATHHSSILCVRAQLIVTLFSETTLFVFDY
jgi:hypothetical protein